MKIRVPTLELFRQCHIPKKNKKTKLFFLYSVQTKTSSTINNIIIGHLKL